MGLRYQVIFKLLYPDSPVSYDVASVHGAQKAIVIATERHKAKGSGHILSVAVESLDGDKPRGSDLVDRMEW